MSQAYNVETLRQLAKTSDFFSVLLNDFNRYDALTEKQVKALNERDEPVSAKKDVVNIDHIERAFAHARNQGIQKPRLHLAGFSFRAAPTYGKNPGAVYVTDKGDTYLGKVLAGKLFGSKDCTKTLEERILQAMQDPKGAAEAFGKKFGRCSICSRTLTDPESIEKGIGPICASRFGW